MWGGMDLGLGVVFFGGAFGCGAGVFWDPQKKGRSWPDGGMGGKVVGEVGGSPGGGDCLGLVGGGGWEGLFATTVFCFCSGVGPEFWMVGGFGRFSKDPPFSCWGVRCWGDFEGGSC